MGFDNYEGIDISLHMKAKYTSVALSRLGKAKPKWTKYASLESKYHKATAVISGVTAMVQGVMDYDSAAVIEGAEEIGPVLLAYFRDKSWYDTVDLMRGLSQTDFPLFKKTFFDNTYEDKENKENNEKI